MVGNEGFYVYQQVYPIYGIAMTLALSGVPVFISRVIAEYDEPAERIMVARRLFSILLVVAWGLFAGLQLFAPQLASVMGDGGLTAEIRAATWLFVLVPFLAVSRGYFQGQLDMVPTSQSQLAEQVVRVGVILFAAYYGMQKGWSVYQIGTLAMFSATIAGLMAILILWRRFLPVMFMKVSRQHLISSMQLLKRLASEGLLICLVAAVLVLLQLVDSLTVVDGLRQFGLSFDAAKNVKGIYDRAQTLVQLGLVFSVALSTTLLPGLVATIQKGEHQRFQYLNRLFQKLNFALALTISIGLISVLSEMNTFLFGDAKLPIAISLYLLNVWLMALITMKNSILQSLNQQRRVAVAVISGLVIKSLLNSVAVAQFGVIGAAVMTNLALVCMLFVMYGGEVKHIVANTANWWFVGKLVVALVGMVGGVLIAKHTTMVLCHFTTFSRGQALVLVAVESLVGAFVFVGLSIWLKLFTKTELQTIPYLSTWLEKYRPHGGK
ncbi:polysaccharide transporter [Secundilactobacillus oryzae JCM 18671]|uniref:Polysaccharide transporter n=2 Tax=Secundilactobacillus oryzae TaxID=1202668 RepID=A0A081BH22_9LACO|nr:polysaccharide transporter [Secundilactobacillus oryzae JCM 18671]